MAKKVEWIGFCTFDRETSLEEKLFIQTLRSVVHENLWQIGSPFFSSLDYPKIVAGPE